MKTESELRKLRAAFRHAQTVPCQCAGTEHALHCFIGGKMAAANELLLAWVLGEAGDSAFDRYVEIVLAAAAQVGGR